MKNNSVISVDHDLLKPGLYVYGTNGNIVIYDLRMAYPNSGEYLDYDEIHTFEHLFATYARNTILADSIVHVGPMASRTGFKLLIRSVVSHVTVIALIQKTLGFIADYEGEIPGATPRECANASEHNLFKARKLAARMLTVLEGWTPEMLDYAQ